MDKTLIKEIELNDNGEIIAMKGIISCKKPIKFIDDLMYNEILRELEIQRML